MDYPIQLTTQLSQHLRSFRQLRGMTQIQLAKYLGLTQSRIAEIEADPGRVSVENLLKILSALNIQLVLQDKSDLGITQLIPTTSTPKTDEPNGIELLQLLKKNSKKPSEGNW